MIHSGINAYLTLDLAQTLLRAEDPRYMALLRSVADLASPTGNWPEAVHPFSGGGCMGDGQHGWAAAEWIMMIRNMFVREEGARLIIGSGVPPSWLQPDNHRRSVAFGPTATSLGRVEVGFIATDGGVEADIQCQAHQQQSVPVDVCVPGFKKRLGLEIKTRERVWLVPA